MRIKIFITLLLFLAMAGIAEEWMTFTTDDGLAHNECQCVAVDHDGLVWVGSGFEPTWDGGVSVWDGTSWQTYFSWTTDFALRSNVVNDVFVDSRNNKWFATGTIGSPGGVTKFDGVNWTYFNLDSMTTYLIQWSSCISEDQYGNIWVGSTRVLAKFDTEDWSFYPIGEFGIVGDINKIISTDDELIALTSNGACVIDFDSLRVIDELPMSDITDFDLLFNEAWFTTDNGVYIISDTSIEHISASDSGLINPYVLSIEIIDSNNIWFGTSLGPVFFNGYSWINTRNDSTIPCIHVTDIICDSNDNILLTTSEGLLVYNKYSIEWDICEQINHSISHVTIFPNPFTTSCSIQTIYPEKFIIFDCCGRQVDELPINSLAWKPDKKINSGVYFLSNYTTNNTKKIYYIK